MRSSTRVLRGAVAIGCQGRRWSVIEVHYSSAEIMGRQAAQAYTALYNQRRRLRFLCLISDRQAHFGMIQWSVGLKETLYWQLGCCVMALCALQETISVAAIIGITVSQRRISSLKIRCSQLRPRSTQKPDASCRALAAGQCGGRRGGRI